MVDMKQSHITTTGNINKHPSRYRFSSVLFVSGQIAQKIRTFKVILNLVINYLQVVWFYCDWFSNIDSKHGHTATKQLYFVNYSIALSTIIVLICLLMVILSKIAVTLHSSLFSKSPDLNEYDTCQEVQNLISPEMTYHHFVST